MRSSLASGPLLLGLGLVVALCGALVAARRGSAIVIAIAALASIVAFGLTLVAIGNADVDVSRRYGDLAIRDVAVQWGYYVELAFAAACIAAAVLVFLRRATEKRL